MKSRNYNYPLEPEAKNTHTHARVVGIALAAAGSFVWVNEFNAPKIESWKGGWPKVATDKQQHTQINRELTATASGMLEWRCGWGGARGVSSLHQFGQ